MNIAMIMFVPEIFATNHDFVVALRKLKAQNQEFAFQPDSTRAFIDRVKRIVRIPVLAVRNDGHAGDRYFIATFQFDETFTISRFIEIQEFTSFDSPVSETFLVEFFGRTAQALQTQSVKFRKQGFRHQTQKFRKSA